MTNRNLKALSERIERQMAKIEGQKMTNIWNENEVLKNQMNGLLHVNHQIHTENYTLKVQANALRNELLQYQQLSFNTN